MVTIREARCHPATQQLTLWFPEGRPYRFCRVPVLVWQGLQRASSKDRYFSDNMDGRYACQSAFTVGRQTPANRDPAPCGLTGIKRNAPPGLPVSAVSGVVASAVPRTDGAADTARRKPADRQSGRGHRGLHGMSCRRSGRFQRCAEQKGPGIVETIHRAMWRSGRIGTVECPGQRNGRTGMPKPSPPAALSPDPVRQRDRRSPPR